MRIIIGREGIGLAEGRIVLRCQAGELGLFEELYEMYRTDLYRFCVFLAGDPEAAGDIFQDTWVRAIKNIGRYDPQREFRKWLFAIAVNLQRDRWRRLKRWTPLFQGLHPAQDPGPEEITQTRLERDLLYDCLAALPDKQRIPIVLHYIEGFSLEEVAGLLTLPVGTVKSRLHYGKLRLKKMLEVAGHG
ncbi:MAG: RNA polymerase sigma factor [Bacillota bacterium]|jgi:RNA polymerase sigma-70 factor (ECF subfamily)